MAMFQTAFEGSESETLDTLFPDGSHPELVVASRGVAVGMSKDARFGLKHDLCSVEPVDFVNRRARRSTPGDRFPPPHPPNDLFISHSGGHLLHGDTSAMKGLLSSL